VNLRAGIFGCGPDGLWSAARMARLPQCELAALGDRDPARLATAVEGSGVALGAATFDELLATGVDFVVLAGDLADRPALVSAAAEQGVSCLLHAPCAASAAEAEALQAHCDAGGARFGVLVRAQGEPVFEQLREMVASGWFGGIAQVQCLAGSDDLLRHPPVAGDPRLAAAAAADPLQKLASHHVHLVRWLTGLRPRSVSVQPSAGFLPLPSDGAVATVRLCGHAMATFAASWRCAADDLALYGHDGRVRVSASHVVLAGRTDYDGPCFAYRAGTELVLERAGLGAGDAPASDLHGRVAQALDDCGDFPCPGEQAIEDLRLLDAIARALRTGTTEDVS
jgi:predicted dehydrogenase